MKVTEENYSILKKASDITNSEYEIKWTDAENIEGYVDPEELLSIIEDLTMAYEDTEEELRSREQYCEEYHVNRYKDEYDMYGLSRNDF